MSLTQEDIAIGAADAKQGDTYFAAFTKIQNNFNTLFGAFADNVIVVNSESDFDQQDATTITLIANHQYIIGAAITTSKRFIVEDGASISSINPFSVVLVYTGGGAMFTSSSANWSIRQLGFSCPAATIFDVSGVNKTLLMADSLCVAANSVGSFTDISLVVINAGIFGLAGSGFVMSGIINILSISKLRQETTSASHIAVNLGTATFDNLEITNFEPDGPSGSVAISGAASSANINANRVATIKDSTLNGGSMTPLAGITTNDIRYRFDGNSGVADTIEDALISLTANATQTVTALNTPAKVAGTWVVERDSFFSGDTTGRCTYLGERPVVVPIDVSTTISAASGTNKDISIYFAVNGAVIANSRIKNKVSVSDPRNTSSVWQYEFNQNDYVEVWIENNTDSINLICEDAVLRVR